MSVVRRRALAVLRCCGSAGLTLAAAAVPAVAVPRTGTSHVLLLSVDGMHQSDLARYVAAHPSSALAALTRDGKSFTRAKTPAPSDQFPGLLAQVTGGNPRTTGVYYDVSYDCSLLPAGTTTCRGTSRGAGVAFDESLDVDTDRLDAGEGLTGLPGSILTMTGQPRQVIDPSASSTHPPSRSAGCADR